MAVLLAHAHEREAQGVERAGELQGDHPRQVAGQGHHGHVHLQAGDALEVVLGRRVHQGRLLRAIAHAAHRAATAGGQAEPPLQVAHGLEVLAELVAILGRELAIEPGEVAADDVQHAAPLHHELAEHLGIGVHGREEALPHAGRVVLRRHGLVRPQIADARAGLVLDGPHPQLQGGEARLRPELAGDVLVDGDATGPACQAAVAVGEGPLEDDLARQQRRHAPVVGAAGALLGHQHVDAVRDDHALLVALERQQDLRQREVRLRPRRAPALLERAVGVEEDDQALGIDRRGLGGPAGHDLEQGQGDREAAEPAKETATRDQGEPSCPGASAGGRRRNRKPSVVVRYSTRATKSRPPAS